MKKKQKIKAICQPEFFAKKPKYRAKYKKLLYTGWLLAPQVPAPNRRSPPHHPKRNQNSKNKLILLEKTMDCEKLDKPKHGFLEKSYFLIWVLSI